MPLSDLRDKKMTLFGLPGNLGRVDKYGNRLLWVNNEGGVKFSPRHFTDEEKARRRAARRKAKGKTPASNTDYISDWVRFLSVSSLRSFCYKHHLYKLVATLSVTVGIAFWCYFS